MAPKPESTAKLAPLGREFRGVSMAGAYTRELFWRAFKDSLAKFDPRGTIAAEAGVDDFVAEMKPEEKLQLVLEEQSKGRLVAMTGDGTNDAPALAQADVGLAMHSGTMPAKEAANLIDLDSDPTKLTDLVAIGRQMLITRGALTTFSIANDVAKYFAIIPAMFIIALPGLAALNVMGLATPQSAVLSALIFNALIIPLLIPLALRGVHFPGGERGNVVPAEPLDLWPRWPDRPFYRDQADRSNDRTAGLRGTHHVGHCLGRIARLTGDFRVVWVRLSFRRDGTRAVAHTVSGAWQSRDERRGRGSWLAIDRAELDRPEVVPRPPIGDDGHRSEQFDEDNSRAL